MDCDLPARDEPASTPLSRDAGLRQVLLALASGKAVSQTELAARSGMTRSMTCELMDALCASGLPLRSPAPASYQLPWSLQLLDGQRIRASLPGAVAGQLGALEVHAELDSTSTELRRRGATAPDLSVVLAEMQSAGRGRRGRHWLSPPGLNIHVSCLKRFDCEVAGLAGLSLVVGLSVVRALQALDIQGAGLKWPNDVLARYGSAAGGKLAGILVELGRSRPGQCVAIIGIGLNVRLTSALRDQVDQATCDLATLNGGEPPERNQVAARLIAELVRGLQQFESDGFAPFHVDYARHDLLFEQRLQVTDARGAFTGVGAGVDARGALLVRLADGSMRAMDSAEVTVRRQ